MLTVEEYRERVLAGITPLPVATTALHDAIGLVLAEDISTPRPMPGFDNSSMDGYAVHAADFTGSGPVTLRVIDDLPAGATTRPEVPRGCAARIMTGAPMPLGADCVVPVELTDGGTESVVITATPGVGDCIRRAGEDMESGRVAVARGSVLSSRNLGLIASCDRDEVAVIARPRVTVISTGSELVRPGGEVGFGQVVDSNNSVLAAAALEAGARVRQLGPVVDDADAFTAALEDAAATSDLILTSGGVSMGAYDTVKEVLTSRGGVEFMKVAMQPGMPQGHGAIDGVPIITLPGNPVSSFVSFEVFVRPAIRRMMGLPEILRPERTAELDAAMTSPPRKVQFARGVLEGTDVLRVSPAGGQGSHFLGSLAVSNCLMVIPVGVAELAAGDRVTVLDLR